MISKKIKTSFLPRAPSKRLFPLSSILCPLSSRIGGQSIVELVVALSVTVVGILAMLALYSQSFALNRVVAEEYTGTYLAAEGVEVAKSIFDANKTLGLPWNEGFILAGEYEADYTNDTLTPATCDDPAFATPLNYDAAARRYGYGAGDPTDITRCLFLSPEVYPAFDSFGGPHPFAGEQYAVRVLSRVVWETRGGGMREIQVEDHFFRH
jgi:hypothetical protein